MLMQSEIDPFTAPETKPYKSDPEILAMTNLVSAYQRNEILEFEHILRGAFSRPSQPFPAPAVRPLAPAVRLLAPAVPFPPQPALSPPHAAPR